MRHRCPSTRWPAAPTRSPRCCAALGVRKGDAVVLMLGNQVELWESMLAVIKIGAVVMPTTTAVGPGDLVDRMERGSARAVITNASRGAQVRRRAGRLRPHRRRRRPAADAGPAGRNRRAGPVLTPHTEPRGRADRAPGHGARRPDAPLLHVRHDEPAQARRAHAGVLPGRAPVDDVLARPAARATSTSTSAAPGGPSTRGRRSSRRGPPRRRSSSTTTCASTRRRCSACCAPTTSPRCARRRRCGGCSSTSDLSGGPGSLREVIGAGEPLNPEVIAQVERAWGLTIRDGYGQTEMTAAVGNTPGSPVKPGSMGRPLPGRPVVIVDPLTNGWSPTSGRRTARWRARSASTCRSTRCRS